MKNYSCFISLLFLLLLGSSCSRGYYYSPYSANHLTVSEKGDAAVSGAMTHIGVGDKYQAQAAYSPVKHLAVAGSFGAGLSNVEWNDFTTRTYSTNLAIGTYFLMNPKPPRNLEEGSATLGNIGLSNKQRERSYLFEAYLSYGQGRTKNSYGLGQNDFVKYNTYGLQFGIYYRSKFMLKDSKFSYHVGFITRPTILEFYDATVVGTIQQGSVGFYELLEERSRFGLAEYTLTTQLGVGRVRFFINTNFIVTSELTNYIDNGGSQFGALIEIDGLFKGIRKK